MTATDIWCTLWVMSVTDITVLSTREVPQLMRVFVTGASGWIGSAVVRELVAASHQVVGLARSDASAAVLAAAGAAVHPAPLDDRDPLPRAPPAPDAVIH